MKNQVQSKAKLSKLERDLNKYMVVIVMIQLIMSLAASFLGSLYELVYARDFAIFTGVSENE